MAEAETVNDRAKRKKGAEGLQKIENGEEGGGEREGNAMQLDSPLPIYGLCVWIGNVEVNSQSGKVKQNTAGFKNAA